MMPESIKRKRGRPKGSKNKVKAMTGKKRGRPPKTDNRFFIGTNAPGTLHFTFPIVQEETTKKPVAFLGVAGQKSFYDALTHAVLWARHYSSEKNANYYPLVRYNNHPAEKRYVKSVPTAAGYVYAESKDFGSWLHVHTLEAI